MKRQVVRQVARLLLLVLAFAMPVWAAESPLPPLELCAPGKLCAPTVLTESGGANPIAVTDLPSLSSDQLRGLLSDETGTGAACFATGPSLTTPSISGGTYTGTQDFSGATVQLPSNAVDDIGEVSDSILAGSPHGPLLATTENPVANRCARYNANGVLEPHTGDCASSTPIPPVVFIESQFPIPAGEETTYVSLAGNISGASGQAQTLVFENMTLDECCFVYTGNPGSGVIVTLASGTYGGSLSDSNVSVTLVAANTPVCDSDALALTQGQGVTAKVDGASDTQEGQLRGGCKRTA